MPIRRIDTRQTESQQQIRQLRELWSPSGNVVSEKGRQLTIEVFGQPLSPAEVVDRIINDVKNDGLSALLHYSQKLDRADLSSTGIRVAQSELVDAHRAVEPEFLAAVRTIRNNIVAYQQAILHQSVEVEQPGAKLGLRYLPVDRAGCLIPGGMAAYPSTLLMTVVPAQVAGVKEIAVVAPPTQFGAHNKHVLATCHELGVTEVYRIGGAQAVAALAYGVEGLPVVSKIVGPGNMFVALAKQQLSSQVGIDMIAGPSEVVVLADDSAPVDFVAADMLAQAEHAPGAAVLVTWSSRLADQVAQSLDQLVAKLSRKDLTVESLERFGAIIVCRDHAEGCELTNMLAPEHLAIMTNNPRETFSQIRHAGAAFLGPFSPVALGDYYAGPSHTLPTGGTARFASGLSCNDFLKRTSTIEYTEHRLQQASDDIVRLANVEGLTAHAASITVRCPKQD